MSLRGHLHALNPGELFQVLKIGEQTGVLWLTFREKFAAQFVFRAGNIIAAWSPEGFQKLSLLARARDIETPPALERLSENPADPLSLLKQLLASDTHQEGAFTELISAYVEREATDFLKWEDGDFHFEVRDRTDKPQIPSSWELIEDPLNPLYLRLEEARVRDEKEHIEYEDLRSEVTKKSTDFIDLVSELEKELDLPRSGVSTPAPNERGKMTDLKSLLVELRTPGVFSEVILLILRYAATLVHRSIIFSVQGDSIVAAGEFGLSSDAQEMKFLLQKLTFSAKNTGLFSKALTEGRPILTSLDPRLEQDRQFIETTGGRTPRESYVCPIQKDGTPVALLYGDNLPETTPLPPLDTLEIFISQAELAIKLEAHTRKSK